MNEGQEIKLRLAGAQVIDETDENLMAFRDRAYHELIAFGQRNRYRPMPTNEAKVIFTEARVDPIRLKHKTEEEEELPRPVTPPPTVYWNTEQTYTASCPEGTTGDSVTETTPAHTYSSVISQADADAQALAAATSLAESELVCVGVTSCHCESFGNQNHSGSNNDAGISIVPPSGLSFPLNWGCARALQYTYSGSGGPGTWSSRTAFNATYQGTCETSLPNPVSWFYTPTDAVLESCLADMTTPPDTSGAYNLQVTFYFSTSRHRGHADLGGWEWKEPESASAINLMAVCYKSV